MDFTVPADLRKKRKQNKKIYKYLDLARELNVQWNMRMKVILIATGALGTVSKGLERGLEELETEKPKPYR